VTPPSDVIFPRRLFTTSRSRFRQLRERSLDPLAA
jgi:hypothetical protein